MQRSRAGLFLMELTISLLFFAIASAVCIQLFVKAHNINKECDALSNEHIIASNIAECYRAGQILSLVPEMTGENGECRDGDYSLNFGSDNKVTSEGAAAPYSAGLSLKDGTLDITVTSADSPDTTYSLSVYRYFTGEVSQ